MFQVIAVTGTKAPIVGIKADSHIGILDAVCRRLRLGERAIVTLSDGSEYVVYGL